MILEIDQGPNAGQRWTFDGPEITIGRDITNDVWVEDDRVSQFHARLWHDGNTWRIEDLDSTNGTWVNNHKLTASASLRPGDQLRVGLTVFSVSYEPLSVSKGVGYHPHASALGVAPSGASIACKTDDSTQPEEGRTKATVVIGLVDGLIALAALMLIAGANMPWIRISVDVPFVGNLDATPSGTAGLGTYTMLGGVLALVLVFGSLIAQALIRLHTVSQIAEFARAFLRWCGIGHLLIAATLLFFAIVSLARYYQSANRDVFLGIRLIDLFDFAVDWLNLLLIPQIGLILSGLGLGLLLLAAVVRLALAIPMEKSNPPVAQESSARELMLQQGTGPVTEFPVFDGITLGRSEENDIVIQDETASRHHAEIRWQEGGHVIIDRQSTNGVWVNDQRITAPHRLLPGERIRVGSAVFTVRYKDHPNPTAHSSGIDPRPERGGTQSRGEAAHPFSICPKALRSITPSHEPRKLPAKGVPS